MIWFDVIMVVSRLFAQMWSERDALLEMTRVVIAFIPYRHGTTAVGLPAFIMT